MPWYSPGIFPVRTWIHAPNAETLRKRWRMLMAETDPDKQADLFRKGRDASLDKAKKPLPGPDVHHASGSIRANHGSEPRPVRVGYGSFDRQWILPDSRLMEMPRPDLWAARVPGQVFVIEQHMQQISDGPGIVVSALIPDFHYFNVRGGRTLPFLYPDQTPNLAPGLTTALTRALDHEVTAPAVLAYIAGVVSHPGYTQTFADELTTPGIHVPFTTDPILWDQAVKLGNQVIWLQTYGAAFSSPDRPQANVRLPVGDPRHRCVPSRSHRCQNQSPTTLSATCWPWATAISLPVRPEVMEYTVGGRNIFKSWFDHRKKEPGGRKGSELDHEYPGTWDADWTTEAIDLLTVLTRLVELEPAQADVLTRILAGDLISMDELAKSGNRWPASQQDRKPRFGYNSLRPVEPSANQELW